MKRLLSITTVLLLVGCTNPESATSTLKANGFTNINITGYNFTGCGKDDFYHTGFVAKTPIGVSASGTVCAGVFKGNTIRFD